jgi:hypothetical protein
VVRPPPFRPCDRGPSSARRWRSCRPNAVILPGVVTATLASWIIERVGEEDAANQAVTVAHIEELRAEIRRLAKSVTDDREPAYGEARD